MSTDTIEARVARGAALLDEKLPGWWREDRPHPIDLDKLDLESACNCVLGQTWDGDAAVGDEYWQHAEELFGDVDATFTEPGHYGFNAIEGKWWEYNSLTSEWKRLILARRGGES